jgi:hypothetical protein
MSPFWQGFVIGVCSVLSVLIVLILAAALRTGRRLSNVRRQMGGAR